MPSKTLEERIQAIEDVEAIKKLKYRYGEACDDQHRSGHKVEDFVALFTEDAVWDLKEFGSSRGRNEIQKHQERVLRDIRFSAHFFVQPQIEVEEATARARWYLLGLFTSLMATMSCSWQLKMTNAKRATING